VLPVYGPPAETALLAATDREVEVTCKMIEPGRGRALELWVADPGAVRAPTD
jgi:hypothetical protein